MDRLKYLDHHERALIHRVLDHKPSVKNPNAVFDDQSTGGQRFADRVAAFGGSWTFIIIFLSILTAWVLYNTLTLTFTKSTFDPYPFILLNLILSMLAAIQAPIIMMSQNRQAAKDRLDATHDYEINIKAEIEIASLHEKLDQLREQQWMELVEMQQAQIKMLTELLEKKNN